MFLEFLAYGVFIILIAAPYLVAAVIIAMLAFGVKCLTCGLRQRNAKVTILGLGCVALALFASVSFYDWLRGPPATLARLEPIATQTQISVPLPKIWVMSRGAAFTAIDLLPNGIADRVLQERQGNWEEVFLVDSPKCKKLLTADEKSADQLQCTFQKLARNPTLEFGHAYIQVTNRDDSDARSETYSIVDSQSTTPIARCGGKAPYDPNPLLGIMRGNRGRDVARSIYLCRREAQSGGLARIVSGGKNRI
jgi:hypothetical protein